jgi:hypothetical protein
VRAARKIAEVVMGELSAVDRERLRAAIADRGDIHAQQALQWVQELHRTSSELAAHGTAAHADTRTVFWIRLLGVLVEVGESYEYLCKLADDSGAGATPLATDARAVRDAIRATIGSMDEDQRMWLHYRRDVECHVWQSSYELNRGKNGLKETRYFALLGKEMHVDEFDTRARTLLRVFGVDEPALAAHFAKVVAPHVAMILEAMRPLY